MNVVSRLKTINEQAAILGSLCNQGLLASLPVNLEMILTNRCNYRCRMCYQNDFTKELDFETILSLRDVLSFVKYVTILGGEPFVYSRLDDLLRLLSDTDCLVNVCTNGSLLTPERNASIVSGRFNRISISLDAASPKTYKFVRKGDFTRIIKNVMDLQLQKLKSRSDSPAEIQFNYVLMRENLMELPKLVVLAGDIGVRNIRVNYMHCATEELAKSSVFFQQAESDAILVKVEEIARQHGVHLQRPALFSETTVSDAARVRCDLPWRDFHLFVDGQTSLCCGGNGAMPGMGALPGQTFETLWNGNLARKVRETINTPKELSFCRNCFTQRPCADNIALHIPDPDLAARAAAFHGQSLPEAR
jgi:MoaA/NifB/PqqE/SkfB family radical SAM enzyme